MGAERAHRNARPDAPRAAQRLFAALSRPPRPRAAAALAAGASGGAIIADMTADAIAAAWNDVNVRIARAAPRGGVTLVAVSKTHPPEAIRALAACGARAFGENYVQEALGKQVALADLALEWHAIGPLQSNKAREVARHFDWLQTLDRAKLIEPLARHRDPHAAPLNVLIQVNIDDEASKSGCAPADVPKLAGLVAAQPTLRLRGLMAIPAPLDLARR